jgi:hypothetical protein
VYDDGVVVTPRRAPVVELEGVKQLPPNTLRSEQDAVVPAPQTQRSPEVPVDSIAPTPRQPRVEVTETPDSEAVPTGQQQRPVYVEPGADTYRSAPDTYRSNELPVDSSVATPRQPRVEVTEPTEPAEVPTGRKPRR